MGNFLSWPIGNRPQVGNLPHKGIVAALLAASLCAAAAAQPALTVRVADVTVPAGGVAQIQVFLDSPHTLLGGELVLDFDTAVFGDVLWTDLFSATGDQIGAATATGGHLDVTFGSQTGSVGRLPGLPVMVVSVPVLASVAPGTKSVIQVKSGTQAWTDSQNIVYTVNGVAGNLTVGGSLSVKDVQPGGGPLGAKAVVRIEGTGFSSNTNVTIAGVAHSAARFVSAQEVDVTLDGPADLTGKRVIVSNPGGQSVMFFSALRGKIVHRPLTGPLSTAQPILPSQTYAAAEAGSFLFPNSGVAIQNPGTEPVDVLIRNEALFLNGFFFGPPTTVTLAPGEMYLEEGYTLSGGASRGQVYILPSAPIRAAVVGAMGAGTVSPTSIQGTQVLVAFDDSIASVTAAGFPPGGVLAVRLPAGKKVTKLIDAITEGASVPYTVSAKLDSGSGWLNLAISSGSTCVEMEPPSTQCPDSSKIATTFDATSLSAGVYRATLNFVPQGYNPSPTNMQVVLTVDSQPFILSDVSAYSFGSWPAANVGLQVAIHLTTDGDPQNYFLTTNLPAGQKWLTVDPGTGVTPSQMRLFGDFTGLAPGHYSTTVTIHGPNNSVDIPVDVDVTAPIAPSVLPSVLSVALKSNFGVYFTSIATPFGQASVSTQTSDGGTWLAASTGSLPRVAVNIDPSRLAVGVYHGTITITGSNGAVPVTVPVTLTVYDATPALTVSASSVNLTAPVGSSSGQQIVAVSTGSIPLLLTVTWDQEWLSAGLFDLNNQPKAMSTPANLIVAASAKGLTSGVYKATITLTASDTTNRALIAVTLTVIPGGSPPPQAGAVPVVSSILNGASQRDGSLAPGEIVTILGQNIGPAAAVGFAYGADGKVATTLGGVEVRFDGKAAPIIYASIAQLNAIVPYEVSGETAVEVRLNGVVVGSAGVPVAVSAPAVFTIDSSGLGAGAVLNQDGSVNGIANPADRGSTIQIFLTGAGASAPAATTGEITGSVGERVAAAVRVSIGGVDAQVVYAGAAPGAVSGLVQVNAVVPQTLGAGVLPVVVRIGEAVSADGVSVAVR